MCKLKYFENKMQKLNSYFFLGDLTLKISNDVGVKGFEPLNTRTKNDRLATWLYPKKDTNKLLQIFFFIMRKSFRINDNLFFLLIEDKISIVLFLKNN